MSEIVSERVSQDDKLTCRLYLNVEHKYYLASVDLLGQEIASTTVAILNSQRVAHQRAAGFLRGAIETYEACVCNGFNVEWGDDIK